MNIQQVRAGQTIRCSLVGKLWAPEDLRQVADTIRGASDTGITTIVVDMSRLSFMCSQGLGVLVRIFVQLRDKGIRLVFFNPKPSVKEMIELSGVTTVIPMVSTEDELAAANAG